MELTKIDSEELLYDVIEEKDGSSCPVDFLVRNKDGTESNKSIMTIMAYNVLDESSGQEDVFDIYDVSNHEVGKALKEGRLFMYGKSDYVEPEKKEEYITFKRKI